ncbi:MAG TPA: HlyD family type I secretion periplasmic adaptor subunit [Methylomirabilota bacterium]|nr:HlyD family type I secretion periplasmic adaptor subunit [Methylomirabilota bacterium]
MKSANATAPAQPVRSVVPLQHARERRGAELAFLPAALEIVETPPSPIGRAIGATLILLFCAALAWASWGKIDIVASATGKIVATGRTKVIQPLEAGVVRAVHVQDGQAVKAGDVLVELDPTISGAESDRLAKELLAAQLDVNRLRALLSDGDDPAASFVAPDGASPAQIELHRRLLAQQLEEYRAKLANLDKQYAQAEANRAEAAAQVQKLTLAIPLLKKRVAAFKRLVDGGFGSTLQYLTLAQDLIEHQQDLEAQKAKLTETAAAMAALQEQKRQSAAEFRRSNYADLSQAEQRAASAGEQLVAAQQRQHLQTLTAPVDGTVQQLAVHTVGGVVTPAQQLMAIVPADSGLEIEAMVSNRDIGFVGAGQPAEIKIDTFDFTRYGLLHGRVLSVSQDAIIRDRPQDRAGDPKPATPNDSSEPKGQELNYSARVSLDRSQMQVDDRLVNLSPGMAVTVEIKTGSRIILSYLLSPLLRYGQESLRER